MGGDSFKDLIIAKQVEGALGDKDMFFDFTLKIESGSGRKTYMVSETPEANNNPATVTAGQEYKFKLKHGQQIKVENLSTSDTYTITEAKVANYEKNGEVLQAKAMAKDRDITETITNTRDAVTPTGLLMDYAPYLLMVAAVAVFGLLFFRRRNQEID